MGRSLVLFRSRVQRSKKTTFFGHLIPYIPGLRIFSGKQFCSTNGPYCPLHSCKKLGRSWGPFWRKVQRSKKATFFGHLIPYNPRLRISLKIPSANSKILSFWVILQKIGWILRGVIELSCWLTNQPTNQIQEQFYKTRPTGQGSKIRKMFHERPFLEQITRKCFSKDISRNLMTSRNTDLSGGTF